MPPHACTKEREVERLNKVVFGNGEKGLVQNVEMILAKLEGIEETMGDLKRGVGGLIKFQTEVLTEGKVKEKSSTNWWQTVSVIIGIGGVAAAFIAIFVK